MELENAGNPVRVQGSLDGRTEEPGMGTRKHGLGW